MALHHPKQDAKPQPSGSRPKPAKKRVKGGKVAKRAKLRL